MTDDMVEIARTTFVPMIKSAGADRVEMVQTGDLSMSVVTHWPSAETASQAQAKITEIRAKATNELPMTMDSVQGGEVFAQG
ncbi:hypothetical protein [Puniceibacterium confluentis]|uniref:hypothetical protein n=1 Tax=Puniceibacterium confluentis TaxID=1958944 RepID=UPI0011B82C2A|nr:hypothetical protein [Puniceibacterium confluentis]